jgi:hypothetical protein
MGRKTFSNSIEGFNLIYSTSARYGGVFPKSRWYTRMSRLPDLFTDRDVYRHARARKLIGPAFNFRNVNNWGPTMEFHIDRLVDDLQKSGGEGIELGHVIHCFMTDLMFDINIGKRTNCLETGMRHFGEEEIRLTACRQTCSMDCIACACVLLGNSQRSIGRHRYLDCAPVSLSWHHRSQRKRSKIGRSADYTAVSGAWLPLKDACLPQC